MSDIDQYVAFGCMVAVVVLWLQSIYLEGKDAGIEQKSGAKSSHR